MKNLLDKLLFLGAILCLALVSIWCYEGRI